MNAAIDDANPRHPPYTPKLVSIVDYVGLAQLDQLRSVVNYLLAKKIELFVETPSFLTYSVFRLIPSEEHPDGNWQIHEVIDHPVPFAIVDTETLSSMNGTDSFTIKSFTSYDLGCGQWDMVDGQWIVTEQYRLVPNEPFTRTLSQLLLPQHLAADVETSLKSVPPTSLTKSGLPPSELLSVEIDAFCKRKTTQKGSSRKNVSWKRRTLQQNRAILSTFMEIVGDKPVATITPRDYDKYLEALPLLPKHRRTSPQTRDLSIQDILNLGKTALNWTPIGDKTYSHHFITVQQFVKFAHKRNTAVNTYILAEQNVRLEDKNTGRPFSDDHLKALFESEVALAEYRKAKQPYRLWIPLLGLFTGARLDELCQLHTADIGCDDRIPYIDITDDDETKNTKTAASKRKIPLHPKLTALGFLNYVHARQNSKDGNPQLFPELTYVEGHGHHKKATWWFNEQFLPKIGIKLKRIITFHCFRHNVVLCFRDFPEGKRYKTNYYVGHAAVKKSESQEGGAYHKHPTLNEMVEVLDAITYPIDFAALGEITPQTYERLTTYKPSARKTTATKTAS